MNANPLGLTSQDRPLRPDEYQIDPHGFVLVAGEPVRGRVCQVLVPLYGIANTCQRCGRTFPDRRIVLYGRWESAEGYERPFYWWGLSENARPFCPEHEVTL